MRPYELVNGICLGSIIFTAAEIERVIKMCGWCEHCRSKFLKVRLGNPFHNFISCSKSIWERTSLEPRGPFPALDEFCTGREFPSKSMRTYLLLAFDHY